MKHIVIEETNHEFEKVNMFTQFDRTGQYDMLKCKNCGLKVKRRSLYGSVQVLGNRKDPEKCTKAIDKTEVKVLPAKIKVIVCLAVGPQFKNLVPKSIHSVIDPPKGYKNDERGVWVMGVGEPVKILTGEFEAI